MSERTMKQWFEDPPFYPYADQDLWMDQLFELYALQEKTVLYKHESDGNMEGGPENLNKFLIEELGARVYRYQYDLRRGSFNYKYSWADSPSMATFSSYGGEPMFNFYSTNLELYKKVQDFVTTNTLPKRPKGSVYVLNANTDGIVPTTIGKAGLELEIENYTPNVIADLEHVIADLGSPNPCGRLVLMDGVPGVGKTHLVRALLSRIEAMFILVPAGMVESLGQPSLMSTLLDLRSENRKSNLSTIFIIEDADTCLVPRAKDNVDAVSALLNLSDGILGAMIDIRIVCTTNASEDQMDLAIMRPGRLCRRIEVGMLNQDQAAVVYRRLNKDAPTTFPRGFYTLAEIYRSAKDGGWHEGIRQGRSSSSLRAVGFHTKQ